MMTLLNRRRLQPPHSFSYRKLHSLRRAASCEELYRIGDFSLDISHSLPGRLYHSRSARHLLFSSSRSEA